MLLLTAILNDFVFIKVLAINFGINRTVPDMVLLFNTLYVNVNHSHT